MMRRLLVLHLLLSPLLFSTRTVEVFEANKAALLLATAVVLGALGAAAWLRRPAGGFLRLLLDDWLALGVVLFAASAAVSAAFSVSPLISWRGDRTSWMGLRTVLAYLVLFFATRHACRTRGEALPLLGVVAAAVVLTCGYALVQWAGRDPIRWVDSSTYNGRFRPFSTLGHSTYLGVYLAVSLPLLVELGRRSFAARRRVVGAVLVATAAAAAVVTALTLTRSAWLATACMTPVLLAGWWFSGRRRWSAAFGAALLLGAACLVPAVGMERLRHLGDGRGRYPVWRAAWQLFLDRPLCGWGTDAFRLAFGTRRPTDYWQEEASNTPTKAHNELLHVLATQGILGAAAGLVLLAGLARAAVRAWRTASPADLPLVAAVAAGLVAFLVQGLFGFTVAGVGTLVVTLAALLSRWSQTPETLPANAATAWPAAPWFLWPGRVAVAGAAAAVLWSAVLCPLRAGVACADGDRVLADDPAAALACYERAVEVDPDDDRAWMKLSGAAQFCARTAVASPAWDRFDEQARSATDRAVALVPADAYHHATRARWLGERAFLGRGDARFALEAWDEALALDPDNAFLLAEAGRTAVGLGDRARAVRYLTHGLALYPKYAPFEARLGALALAEERFEEARKHLEAAMALDWDHDTDDRLRAAAALAATYLACRQSELALATASVLCDEAPEWAAPPFFCAQALEQLRRTDEAADAYRRVLRLDPSHAAARLALSRLNKSDAE
jgi:O-antigen ligase/tetratricopeptide (TPR) repeat protein